MVLLSGQLDIESAQLASIDVLRRIPKALALRHDILSLAIDGDSLVVAIEDPNDSEVLDRVRSATGMNVRPLQATRSAIRRQLDNLYRDGVRMFENREEEAPAIRALDILHQHAVRLRASDVHIEPMRGGGRARLRVDGILREVQRFPDDLFSQILSRIKLLGGLDIADRRQPQDGRYSIEIEGRSVDARVSTVPTIHGEKLVIRLLENGSQVPSLDRLGMPPQMLERFRHAIQAPHGFVVVCGPTGSGKTTTLYATLAERNVDATSICTVEDPVEIRLTGIAQVQVHAKAGVTFASALRSFLRQDPNVLMVGEMRDEETAAVAASAALSGQLVLTTLHSNDAPRTVQRLLELGMAPHSISAALSAVVAQRLVRRLCDRCRRRDSIASNERRELNIPDDVSYVYRPAGCDACDGTGYRGRIAVFEAIFMNDELRDAVAIGTSSVRFAEIAGRHGYERMVVDGVRHVAAGRTSIAEVLRVVSIEGAA